MKSPFLLAIPLPFILSSFLFLFSSTVRGKENQGLGSVQSHSFSASPLLSLLLPSLSLAPISSLTFS
jgi:hypothetical protein